VHALLALVSGQAEQGGEEADVLVDGQVGIQVAPSPWGMKAMRG